MDRFLAAFIFLASGMSLGAQNGTITWVTLDAPPYYIQSGPSQGQGIGDQIIALLQKNLPEYSHQVRSDLPVARITQLQKEKAPIVMVTTLWSQEKEDYLYFSLPSVINPPTVVVTLKKNAPQFSGEDQISLAALVSNRSLRLGAADRVYGAPLDDLLKPLQGADNIHRRMGNNVFTALLEMLDRGRVDYLLGTPYEVSFARRIYNPNLDLQTFKPSASRKLEATGTSWPTQPSRKTPGV